MGCPAHLTSEEVAVVRALAAENKSMAEIARRLNRASNAVHKFLVKTPNHRIQEKRGRPRKVSPSQRQVGQVFCSRASKRL